MFLAPTIGFEVVFLTQAAPLLHLACPILALVLFVLVNDDHHIHMRNTLVAVALMAAYGSLYFAMVFVIGEERGGWHDHYELGGFLPFWQSALIALAITVAVSEALRHAHNHRHKMRKASFERLYLEGEEFEGTDALEVARAMARHDRQRDAGGELTVPRRALAVLATRYRGERSLAALCEAYVHAYYDQSEGYER